MPMYNFICNNCRNKTSSSMTICSFLQKKDSLFCDKCNSGKIEVLLAPPTGKIERTKEDILREIDEEVRDIVSKINNGDEATFDDIYGNRENPLKN